jgi:CRP-like cAMP-binding protein
MNESLSGDPWFSALDGPLAAAIAAAGRTKRYAAGRAVYRMGDRPNGLHFVLSGEVRLLSYSEAGAQMIALVVRRGDWFGELSTIDGKERPQDATAASEVMLFSLDQGAVERIAAAHPHVWRAIGVLACRHQRQALAYINALVSLPPRARVAALLSGRWLEADGEGTLSISQEEIAASAGLSRQTVNATLRDFEAQKLIVRGYKQIAVLDPTGLRQIRNAAAVAG